MKDKKKWFKINKNRKLKQISKKKRKLMVEIGEN